MTNKSFELLVILDITSFDSELSDYDLFQQIIEKASRVLGINKLALVLDDPVLNNCSGYWGFETNESPTKEINDVKSNCFVYKFEDTNDYIYLEQNEPLSIQDQRYYAIFTHSLGDVFAKRRIRESLRQSEEKYRNILANIQEGYYEVDVNGHIIVCNQAFCKLLDYEFDELKGQNMLDFCINKRQVFKLYRQIWETELPKQVNTIKLKRRDGSITYGEASISLTRNNVGVVTGFNGMVRDITERINYQERLEYMSMHDALTGVYNRAYFEKQLDEFPKKQKYPVSMIIADLDGLKLINDSMGHASGDQLLKSFAKILLRVSNSAAVVARLGGDEFGMIIPNCSQSQAKEYVVKIRDLVKQYNQKNSILPISTSIGVACANKPKIALSEVFKTADDHMLHDKLYRSASMKSEIVKALMATLSEKDFVTHGHAARIGKICSEIATKINLPENQKTDLVLLAKVHDLGKVGIPAHILSKSGSLTSQEYEIMKKHSEKGYRIATSSPHLAGISRLILCHHERWDGNGYPLGLKEDQIPVECRIFAIADTYDALTSTRSYRQPISRQQAVKEIENNAGKQFDPDLVKVAIPVLKGMRM